MTKKIIEAKIISNEEIADMIYRIVLKSEEAAADSEPGRFINVYLRDKSMLLPRPISICLADKDEITLIYRVVGKGTKELSGYQTGEFLSISTPLGQGYYLDKVFEALDG
ncbi:MAG: dihydroorotate dehydrogenase electron transfer subunit, partial [Bacillota bacterium]